MTTQLRRNTATSKEEAEGSCFPRVRQRFLNLQSTNLRRSIDGPDSIKVKGVCSARHCEQVSRQITGQKLSAVFKTDQELRLVRTDKNLLQLNKGERKARGKWQSLGTAIRRDRSGSGRWTRRAVRPTSGQRHANAGDSTPRHPQHPGSGQTGQQRVPAGLWGVPGAGRVETGRRRLGTRD